MKVSPELPFQVVYALFEHQYLGYLFESFVVQLDEQGNTTLKHQNISHHNATEFGERLDDADYELIRLIDELQQESIIKRFGNSRIKKPIDFFQTIYDTEKPNKAIQEQVEFRLHSIKAKVLPLLIGKEVYEMGNDGEPTFRKLVVHDQKAKVYFHVFKNEENTQYFPTVTFQKEKVVFQNKASAILCHSPAWLLVGSEIFTFSEKVEGKKFRPFLKKKYIVIPSKVEETYLRKFICPLVEQHDLFVKGYPVVELKENPKAQLTLSIDEVPVSQDLFGAKVKTQIDPGKMVSCQLQFTYGTYTLKPAVGKHRKALVEKVDNLITLIKIERDQEYEASIVDLLVSTGLNRISEGRASITYTEALNWIVGAAPAVQDKVEINQSIQKIETQSYFIGESSIELSINQQTDWFDIKAVVRFGSFTIPFLKVRQMILTDQRTFSLPNGQIAIIPQEWFDKYKDLFSLSSAKKGEDVHLQLHHIALVNELHEEGHLVTGAESLRSTKEFEKVEEYPIPKSFRGELRPYQKAGYNWMRFLEEYNFGGCLADDMGLGKTVQTLALLSHQKSIKGSGPNLLVMPTSLLYNWEREIHKFAPSLKIHTYTGTNRNKNIAYFSNYDIVLSTYGVVRLDIEILKNIYFNYCILDESQVIKNPGSRIAQAVRKLKARRRLVLTGTPIENSTLDLWSQMHFLNAGLLGTEQYFKRNFQIPIEKKGDDFRREKLHKLIQPFILRRDKSQVAKDLPPKVEQVEFCEMTPVQKTYYEKVKNLYRNEILESIERLGMGGSRMMILQGLNKLRQASNHPVMVEPSYAGTSGKFEEMIERLQTVLSHKHKVLIFSSYVKHLTLVKQRLEELNISFCYLDGQTKDRKAEVDRFQKDPKVPVFLISLKAGGVGLNLTAADYVFILDPWWNPAIENQAIDRAHRIGQKNKVIVYRFISKESIEEKIIGLQERKRTLASDLLELDEAFIKKISPEDLKGLLA